jgi:hypothetical protein
MLNCFQRFPTEEGIDVRASGILWELAQLEQLIAAPSVPEFVILTVFCITRKVPYGTRWSEP